MRALTICQPYAHLIARGEKPIENRVWRTAYRGPLLIHAGKSRDWLDDGDEAQYPDMQFGAVVAIARLSACLFLSRVDSDHYRRDWPLQWRHLGNHEHAHGPFCWILEHVRPLTRPVPCAGARGLWVPSSAIVGAVQTSAPQ